VALAAAREIALNLGRLPAERENVGITTVSKDGEFTLNLRFHVDKGKEHEVAGCVTHFHDFKNQTRTISIKYDAVGQWAKQEATAGPTLSDHEHDNRFQVLEDEVPDMLDEMAVEIEQSLESRADTKPDAQPQEKAVAEQRPKAKEVVNKQLPETGDNSDGDFQPGHTIIRSVKDVRHNKAKPAQPTVQNETTVTGKERAERIVGIEKTSLSLHGQACAVGSGKEAAERFVNKLSTSEMITLMGHICDKVPMSVIVALGYRYTKYRLGHSKYGVSLGSYCRALLAFRVVADDLTGIQRYVRAIEHLSKGGSFNDDTRWLHELVAVRRPSDNTAKDLFCPETKVKISEQCISSYLMEGTTVYELNELWTSFAEDADEQAGTQPSEQLRGGQQGEPTTGPLVHTLSLASHNRGYVGYTSFLHLCEARNDDVPYETSGGTVRLSARLAGITGGLMRNDPRIRRVFRTFAADNITIGVSSRQLDLTNGRASGTSIVPAIIHLLGNSLYNEASRNVVVTGTIRDRGYELHSAPDMKALKTQAHRGTENADLPLFFGQFTGSQDVMQYEQISGPDSDADMTLLRVVNTQDNYETDVARRCMFITPDQVTAVFRGNGSMLLDLHYLSVFSPATAESLIGDVYPTLVAGDPVGRFMTLSRHYSAVMARMGYDLRAERDRHGDGPQLRQYRHRPGTVRDSQDYTDFADITGFVPSFFTTGAQQEFNRVMKLGGQSRLPEFQKQARRIYDHLQERVRLKEAGRELPPMDPVINDLVEYLRADSPTGWKHDPKKDVKAADIEVLRHVMSNKIREWARPRKAVLIERARAPDHEEEPQDTLMEIVKSKKKAKKGRQEPLQPVTEAQQLAIALKAARNAVNSSGEKIEDVQRANRRITNILKTVGNNHDGLRYLRLVNTALQAKRADGPKTATILNGLSAMFTTKLSTSVRSINHGGAVKPLRACPTGNPKPRPVSESVCHENGVRTREIVYVGDRRPVVCTSMRYELREGVEKTKWRMVKDIPAKEGVVRPDVDSVIHDHLVDSEGGRVHFEEDIFLFMQFDGHVQKYYDAQDFWDAERERLNARSRAYVDSSEGNLIQRAAKVLYTATEDIAALNEQIDALVHTPPQRCAEVIRQEQYNTGKTSVDAALTVTYRQKGTGRLFIFTEMTTVYGTTIVSVKRTRIHELDGAVVELVIDDMYLHTHPRVRVAMRALDRDFGLDDNGDPHPGSHMHLADIVYASTIGYNPDLSDIAGFTNAKSAIKRYTYEYMHALRLIDFDERDRTKQDSIPNVVVGTAVLTMARAQRLVQAEWRTNVEDELLEFKNSVAEFCRENMSSGLLIDKIVNSDMYLLANVLNSLIWYGDMKAQVLYACFHCTMVKLSDDDPYTRMTRTSLGDLVLSAFLQAGSDQRAAKISRVQLRVFYRLMNIPTYIGERVYDKRIEGQLHAPANVHILGPLRMAAEAAAKGDHTAMADFMIKAGRARPVGTTQLAGAIRVTKIGAAAAMSIASAFVPTITSTLISVAINTQNALEDYQETDQAHRNICVNVLNFNGRTDNADFEDAVERERAARDDMIESSRTLTIALAKRNMVAAAPAVLLTLSVVAPPLYAPAVASAAIMTAGAWRVRRPEEDPGANPVIRTTLDFAWAPACIAAAVGCALIGPTALIGPCAALVTYAFGNAALLNVVAEESLAYHHPVSRALIAVTEMTVMMKTGKYRNADIMVHAMKHCGLLILSQYNPLLALAAHATHNLVYSEQASLDNMFARRSIRPLNVAQLNIFLYLPYIIGVVAGFVAAVFGIDWYLKSPIEPTTAAVSACASTMSAGAAGLVAYGYVVSAVVVVACVVLAKMIWTRDNIKTFWSVVYRFYYNPRVAAEDMAVGDLAALFLVDSNTLPLREQVWVTLIRTAASNLVPTGKDNAAEVDLDRVVAVSTEIVVRGMPVSVATDIAQHVNYRKMVVTANNAHTDALRDGPHVNVVTAPAQIDVSAPATADVLRSLASLLCADMLVAGTQFTTASFLGSLSSKFGVYKLTTDTTAPFLKIQNALLAYWSRRCSSQK